MENKKCRLLPIIGITVLCSLIFTINFSAAIAHDNLDVVLEEAEAEHSTLQTYIVHVKLPNGEDFSQSEDLDSYYQSFLPATTSISNSEQRILYSYRNVVTGFAAKLTAEEAKSMETKEGFVSARLEEVFPLHTTHTPSFLGLHQGLGFWNQSSFGKGVIIGILDTGVLPDHPSFADDDMPPPPAKWKGKCEFNGIYSCNNKLIGARNFINSTEPPVDKLGHGTHTSSTAAGSAVFGANALGNANGTAVGMAPYAHLAIYKVCSGGCAGSAILAAMDAAIEDGVDVLSLSLGGGSRRFFEDSIALGAFGAMQKGIFVSCSAGNGGPRNGTLSNEAPWILTVGASTIDRSIKATASLGNGEKYDGESLFQPITPAIISPLVYAGALGGSGSEFCGPDTFINADVKGKIVLCERGGIGRIAQGQQVKNASGFGMILMNQEKDGYSTLADPHVLPATHVSYAAGLKIKAYINSTASPTATIFFQGTVIGDRLAPTVTSFSSRGPSHESPGILKPDIIGPGVNIIAAWPVSIDNKTNTKSTFNVISGTSMSCPHLSGIAALLKSAHPDWSPAAIKSAIMTTAGIVNLEGKPIPDERLLPADLFSVGAGHVNPSKANDPGLVYDIQPEDYVPYLCGLNYTDEEVGIIVRRTVKCSEESSIPEAELNYPSFSIELGDSSQTFTRKITNVGEDGAFYKHEIVAPPGVDVKIQPDGIIFGKTNLTATYSVTFSRRIESISLPYAQGYLIWVSEKHSVRSPILVKFV